VNPKTLHLVFAGGGTAGHLFPGLAVAEYLARALPRLKVTFAGTGKALEARLVAAANFDYVTIPSRPMPRRPREAWDFLTTSFSGFRAARRLLAEERVSLVVGLGGYASVPVARAAARRGVPTVLLEQNAYPGRATRWLASSANAICATFAEIQPHLQTDAPLHVVGNPIRAQFAAAAAQGREHFDNGLNRPRQLLVLGGSGGSRTLNEQAPRALYKARAAIKGWQIVHQTGERNAAAVRELYRKFGLKATVSTFFDDVPRLLAETDIAVSRAGGTSLAELAACAVPTILVPYENAADNHQRLNADVLHTAGAADLIDPRDVEGRLDNRLAESVTRLAARADARERLSTSIAQFARPDATRAVASIIRDILRSRQLTGVA
jgi:UDP-N-acetylglucosamine--N-acetylmuramyl-(pentapeptide) pyrophosphoryl-undecaprenol N-acetylglucosamine transferase